MILKKVVFIFMLCAACFNVQGQVTTIGNDSCAEWIKIEAGKSHYKQWILGYLTATNSIVVGMAKENKRAKSDFLKGITHTQIEALVDQHCATQPLHTLQQAAFAVTDILQARR